MYGAFIGDIVGSKYEFDNIKTRDFPLFSPDSDYTDDSVMTAAVAKALMSSAAEKGAFPEVLVETMRDFGRRYPNPMGAYGAAFANWLRAENPAPYGSYGNGSAMRVSPCGLAAVSLDEARSLARISALATHNHPDGVRGAECVAAAVFMARSGADRAEIRREIHKNYYPLDFTLDEIRARYQFDPSCRGTVPQAVEAFLEAEDFEGALRNAVSIGGDSDTLAAITGSIAWSYFAKAGERARMRAIRDEAARRLPPEFNEIAAAFADFCARRAESAAAKD